MGQLRNKCVLNVPETANWTSWIGDQSHWFMKEGVPELCGNASGARCVFKLTLLKQLWYKFELSVFIKKSLYRPE
jgi:hypothetical protein